MEGRTACGDEMLKCSVKESFSNGRYEVYYEQEML